MAYTVLRADNLARLAGILGLGLSEAAYMAEIIRGGFAAVDKGQIEAADSLGMSFSRKLRAVLLPQIMPVFLMVTALTLILAPWNVALWWQLRRLRLAVEMDCDRRVVAASSARPVIHLAVPREYGFMVVDVWSSEEAMRAFEGNEDFRRVLRDAGLPEPTLRVYPLHSLGWPVEAMPLYR